jgi:acyl-CoA thioester hydrolase
MQWLQLQGYTELNFVGTGLIMSDLAIEFKNESFYSDIIEVNIYAGETTRVSFELFYQLSTIKNNTKIILANAKTTMLTYDYEKKKPVSLPDAALKLLTVTV